MNRAFWFLALVALPFTLVSAPIPRLHKVISVLGVSLLPPGERELKLGIIGFLFSVVECPSVYSAALSKTFAMRCKIHVYRRSDIVRLKRELYFAEEGKAFKLFF